MGNTTDKTAKRKVPDAFHGMKGRSGRKPQAATILRRRLIENKVEEAEASFAFLVEVRDNVEEQTPVRVESAKEILNRVIGKSIEMKQDDDNKQRYDRYFERLDKFLNDAEDTPK